MVASFPLRLILQGGKAQQPGSAAAVHHYGPEDQDSTLNTRMNAGRHLDA